MYVLLISFGHFRHASREHKGVFDDKPGVVVAAFKVDILMAPCILHSPPLTIIDERSSSFTSDLKDITIKENLDGMWLLPVAIVR